MKAMLVVPMVLALFTVGNPEIHDPTQATKEAPGLKVYRLSELSQRLPESERGGNWMSGDAFRRVNEALAAIDPAVKSHGPINIWPDVDLVMVDGTQAEQEATKLVVQALRRSPSHEGMHGDAHASALPETQDPAHMIEHIKHELTELKARITDGK